MVRNKVSFDYSFTNEIPQYALNAYKHLNKVALEVRKSNHGMKTRVTINPGDHWPSLMVRKSADSNYVKIDDDTFDAAKAKVIKQARSKSEQRRAQREEEDLLGEAMDQDLDEPEAGTSRKDDGYSCMTQ